MAVAFSLFEDAERECEALQLDTPDFSNSYVGECGAVLAGWAGA
jgi:hypothetical protein